MKQNIINQLRDINTTDSANLIKLEQIIFNNNNIKKTFEQIKDFLMQYYSLDGFNLHINEKDEKEYFLTCEKNIYSALSLKKAYTINNNIEIVFEMFVKEQITQENSKTLLNSLSTLSLLLTNTIYTIYLKEKITALKHIDQTTGLYNRQYLVLQLEKMLPLAQREKHSIGFLCIGINRFKAVIEEFNYDIGQKVLNDLAELLLANLRNSDIVIRLDADEFLVVLPNVISNNNVNEIAKKLIKEFSDLEFIVDENNTVLKKTISIGTSLFPEDSMNIEDIFRHSDISLDEARNSGRSEVLAYSKELDSKIDLF